VRADELAALDVLADHRMPAAQGQLARSLFRRLATIHQGTNDPSPCLMMPLMHPGLMGGVVFERIRCGHAVTCASGGSDARLFLRAPKRALK